MIGKRNVRDILLSALAVLTLVLPLSGLSFAAEEAVTEFTDAAIAVDVIVKIDKATRGITLKNEAGEEYAFIAGPEVKNFDQLKRGDLVIMSYYSGLAIALAPKGNGLAGKASVLKIETAKEGEKPGLTVTGGTFVVAKIAGIDMEHRVVILEGAKNVLALKVSEKVNLKNLKVGQEVEGLYTESYAISVVPAPKVSGTVNVKSKTVAVGIGVSWGEGTLTMYDGSKHEFSVRGLSVIDVGVTSIEATGDVYNLVEAKDLDGVFAAGEAGAAFIGGGSVMALKNGNGVVMKLKTIQKGLRFSLAGKGLKVKLK